MRHGWRTGRGDGLGLRAPVRTLLVHNFYQRPGGEDQVFAAEAGLLEARGHEVLRYSTHNDRVSGKSTPSLARDTVWNGTAYRELRRLVRRTRPRVAHFHNTFPLISPAAYYAVRAEGVPVVQTLHNYRLLCANALLLRDGRVCEDCLGRTMPWPGVVHACYRDSRPASGAVAAMLATHRVLGTWREAVDVYVALTGFARQKFIQGGLPEEKIVVKPNFLHPDPGPGDGRGGYVLFVGRLSREKGVETMLRAWERPGLKAPLKIVGDGPLAPEVRAAAGRLAGVEWLGRQSKAQVLALMKGARFMVFPSVWYEGFPMVFAEASAVGLPMVASDLGSMSSLVDDGRTGLHFRPGDAESLASRVVWLLNRPAQLEYMRRQARREFETRYTAEENYRRLMEIYELAIERARVRT
ncbi:MAG: glycosyltransferase family 4 protein [Actinomycetota bacterium]